MPDRCPLNLDKPCPTVRTVGDLTARHKMIGAFSALGATVDQLETRTGRKRGQWSAGDVAKLGIDYTSITRDGLDMDEIFPSDTLAALTTQAQQS